MRVGFVFILEFLFSICYFLFTLFKIRRMTVIGFMTKREPRILVVDDDSKGVYVWLLTSIEFGGQVFILDNWKGVKKNVGSEATYRNERGRMIMMSHSIPFIFLIDMDSGVGIITLSERPSSNSRLFFYCRPRGCLQNRLKTERCHHIKDGPLQ